MQILQDHLNELEFPKLLEEITPYAYSPRVAEKISNIKPLPQKEAEFLLKKTSDFCLPMRVKISFPLMSMKI